MRVSEVLSEIETGKVSLSVGGVRIFLMGVEWHRLAMQRAVSEAVPIDVQAIASGTEEIAQKPPSARSSRINGSSD